jgi:hypothetical protein
VSGYWTLRKQKIVWLTQIHWESMTFISVAQVYVRNDKCSLRWQDPNTNTHLRIYGGFNLRRCERAEKASWPCPVQGNFPLARQDHIMKSPYSLRIFFIYLTKI